MYKIILVKIAGIYHDNPDGTNRKEILDNLPLDTDFVLENYYFENEKAVHITTTDGKCVGNIPKDLAPIMFDCNELGRIHYVFYKPKALPNGNKIYNVKIYIKTDLKHL